MAALESMTRGNEDEISRVPKSRIILLREFLKRFKETRKTAHLKKGEARRHVNSYIRRRYRKKSWQINFAIRRASLESLLAELFSMPIEGERQQDLSERLSGIAHRLDQCPPESWQEILGVYLRMKRRLDN